MIYISQVAAVATVAAFFPLYIKLLLLLQYVKSSVDYNANPNDSSCQLSNNNNNNNLRPSKINIPPSLGYVEVNQ
jgi:hypothetical protein